MSRQLSEFCETNPIRPFRAVPVERPVRAFSEKQNRQIKANFLNGINSRRLWESQFKANPKPNSWATITPYSLSSGADPERALRLYSVLERVAWAEGTGPRT
jgi:hypothetical protein